MKRIITLCFLMALVCMKGWGQASGTAITTSTTFTVPAGVTSLKIEAWGAGGGGGGSRGTTANSGSAGGGGGGGAYAKKTIIVSSGQTYTITVGAAGTAGAAGNNSGGAGGSTTVTGTGGTVTANGGGGGTGSPINTTNEPGGAGGTVSTGYDAVFAGGAGSVGYTDGSLYETGGGGGGGAGNAGAGGAATTFTSNGGSTGGTGGTGSPNSAPYKGGTGASFSATTGTVAGTAGTAPGGGGSGGASFQSNAAGGAGGSGQVVLTYVSTSPALSVTPTSLAFGSVCTNSTSTSSFVLTGTNLTTATVTIAAVTGYTYSTTSTGTYTSTLTLTPASGSINQTVYVKFSPTSTTANYSGTITISGGGAATNATVTVSGTGINTPPTVIAGTATTTATTASITGNTISTTGCTAVTAYGIEYSTTSGFANGTGTQVAGSGFSGTAGGTFTASVTGLTAGTTYYFHAYATNSGGTSYSAVSSFATKVVNDDCSTAIALACGGSYTGDNTAATDETLPSGTCGSTTSGLTKGVWFTYSATATGTVTVTTCGGATWDTYLRIYSGSCSSLTCIGYDDDNSACSANTLSSVITFNVTAGTTYYILLTGYSSTYYGPYTISATCSCTTSITTQPVSPSSPYCQNSTATALSAAATGQGTPTYQWYSNTSNSSTGGTVISGATASTYIPPTTTVGTKYYYATVTSACGIATSNTATINVVANTVITTQPVSPVSPYCQNATTTVLSVSATGTSLTYQWYSNTTNSNSGGTAISSNGTSSTYTPSTATAGTFYYYVIVSGTCGNVSSSVVAVTVNASTVITVQPSTTNQTICSGSATPLSVTGTGTGTLTYQWYSNTNNSNSGGTSVGSANGGQTATYTPTVTATPTYYYVIVTGGCGTATSNVSGSVQSASITFVSQPSPGTQTICQNTTPTTITTSVSGTDLDFQWYSNTTNSSTGGTPVATNGNARTYVPQTTTAGTTYYYLVVTSTTCTTTATSNTAKVVVNPATSITGQPSTTSQAVCQNGTITPLSVTAVGTTPTYQWYSNTTASTTGGISVGSTNGGQTATYTPSSATAGTLYYYVVVTGSCAPTSVTSSVSGAITVTAQPAAAITYTGTPFCTSTTSASPTQTGTAGGTYSSTTGLSITSAGVINPSTSTPGTYTVTYTVAAVGGCAVYTTPTTVVINQTPTASVAPASSSTGCAGSGLGISFSGTGGSTVTYNISGAQVATAQQVTLPSGTGTTSVTVSTSGNAGTYTYTITGVTLGNCSSTPTGAGSTTTVTINSLPTVAAISGPTNVGIGKNINLSDATAGGVWSSSDLSSATVNASGRVHGVAVGAPVISYTVTDPTSHCSNSATQIVNVYDAAIDNYITVANGNFSDISIWNVNRNNSGYVAADSIPGDSDNVQIKHNVILDTSYHGASVSSFVINYHLSGADTVRGTLTIAPNHYFASAGAVNFNGNSVTVQSTVAGNGAIGQMTGTISGATTVTTERYTDGGNSINGRRAWRFITSPVRGVSINAGWQEGQVYNSTTGTNYVTGTTTPAGISSAYGTLITSSIPNATTAISEGYDYTGGITSVKQYTPGVTSGSWVPLADYQSTTNPQAGTLQDIRVQPAYMLFVRGNRTIGAGTSSSVTTLRATGTLNQGSQTIGVVHTGGYIREVAGNPYPSAIDFAQVYSQNSARIQNKFAVWLSQLGSYGAYTYVYNNGSSYTAVPNSLTGTGTLTPPDAQYIQSGEGFLVYPTGSATGNITVDETVKAPTQQATATTTTFKITDTDKKLYVNLNLKDSDTSATLADGFMVRFDPTYSSDITEDDASKPANFNENWGILSHNTDLIVEARPDVQKTDTVQVHMWNVTQRAYQLQVKGDNWASAPGVHAYLVDNYLATKQEVSLSGSVATISFTVNSDSASWKSDRFSIVFRNDAAVLPVTLTSVKAAAQNGGVNISWTVTNETNIKGYTIERSTDGGTSYTAIGTQTAKNNPAAAMTNYAGFDASPKEGSNLYRIRIEGKGGSVIYSSVVKVTIGQDNGKILITLYPNPVRPSGKVNLQLTNLLAGSYVVSVYSQAGQTVYRRKITVGEANTTQSEELRLGSSLAQGSYEVRISNSKGAVLFADQLVIAR